jgi:hypothetical protein
MSTTDSPILGNPALDEVNRLVDDLLATCPDPAGDHLGYAGEQFDRGLAWVHLPVGLGGLGLSPKFQPTIKNRLFAAGASNPFQRNPMGYGMCGPTIVECAPKPPEWHALRQQRWPRRGRAEFDENSKPSPRRRPGPPEIAG